jgi:hypothetical protein
VSLGVTTTIDIHALGKKMTNELPVKDRRWMLRKYNRFVALSVVDKQISFCSAASRARKRCNG